MTFQTTDEIRTLCKKQPLLASIFQQNYDYSFFGSAKIRSSVAQIIFFNNAKTMQKKLSNIAHQSIRLTILGRLIYRHMKTKKVNFFEIFCPELVRTRQLSDIRILACFSIFIDGDSFNTEIDDYYNKQQSMFSCLRKTVIWRWCLIVTLTFFIQVCCLYMPRIFIVAANMDVSNS